MKISCLSTFYPFRGGIAQFNASLYRELEKNNEVKAFTFKRQYPKILFPGETQFVQEGDEADKITAERVLDSINPLSYWKTAKKIREFKPDLILTKYWMTFFGPSLGTVLKRNKLAKRISILDNVIPHERRFFDMPSNRFFLKHNDGFVVMSDKVLKDLLSIKPDAKYLRIDHPVYDHFGEKKDRKSVLEKLGLSEDKKYLLFFGFIREYKGLDLLIQAMKYVAEDVHLIVAGETYGSFDKYQAEIDASSAKNRIHLYNQYISDDEVAEFFSISEVCVLPYKGATQSGITAISHHFELPIIATDVGGLKESILHMQNGLIVKYPEPKLIAESIETYFKENLKSKFEMDLKKIKEENSWSNFARRVLEFAETI
ncbi:MAG: glycosyltransferase [Crocinitomicaceae bacterium]|nr:glycosyltransferase [Crocinitomicaceae bacterium]